MSIQSLYKEVEFYMKKHLVLFLSLVCFLGYQLFSLDNNQEATVKQFKVLESTPTSTTLEFSLPEFKITSEEMNGMDFNRIDIFCDGYVPEEGLPELPVFSTLVAIPYQGSVSLDVLNKRTYEIDNFTALPAQDYTIADESNRSFSFNADFYNTDSEYPEQTESISTPGIIRDFRVVSLTFCPFTYNPSLRTLKVAESITFKVNFNDEQSENEMTPPEMYSPSFEPVYRSLISNYNEVLDRNIPVHNKRILIIYGANSDQQYIDKLNEFITWKKQKGYKVTAASTSETGQTTNSIKAYIQSRYDNIYTRPEYIILIGDTTGAMPIGYWAVDGGASDYPYQQLAGTDTMGDVFIGRMPVENVNQFLTMVNKVFTYERDTIPVPPAWYNNMLLVGYAAAGQSARYVNRFYKYAGLNVNPDYSFVELYDNITASTMQNTINSGVAFFVYRGWMGMNGWSNPSEIDFTNANKMPHCIINTCATGDFNSSTTTDTIVRFGTPASPQGAITAIGMSTASTHTLMNNVLSSQTGDGIFNWGMRDMGAPLLTSKLLLYMIYNDFLPDYAVNFPGWCNLMGDPTVEVFVGDPEPIIAEYPISVFPGQICYPVHVEDSLGNPMEGAVVTIVNSSHQLIGETDAFGNVVFDLPDDLIVSDSFIVTVSKHDHVPVYESIMVLNPNGISISNVTYLDGGAGNGDGNPDAGEVIDLNITLTNLETVDIAGAVVELSSLDQYVTIIQNSSSYGTIPAGGSSVNTTAYQIRIAGNTPPEHNAAVKLEVTGQDFSTYLGLDIHNADISIDGYQLYDDNGILEPGESAWLALSLINNSTHLVDGITAHLSCESQLVYFDDADAFYGNAIPGSVITNITDGLSIGTRSQLLTGTDIKVNVHLTNDAGFDQSLTFNVPTGTQNLGSPTGPDAYGHYIYHSNDTNWPDAPVYNWIGIAPGEGGAGTRFASITDSGTDSGDGDVTGADTIDNTSLPFTFTYYGRDYNEVYVCSNGFFTFVPTEVGTFRNFPIPGPMSPDPLVAPFWDDLVFPGGSGIYHWYDANNHYFVIEWYSARNGFNESSVEQFQAILYDPEYYRTATGDGMIKIQYHTFNDIDAGNANAYPPLCGQYCSVGFSDYSGTDGIQYLFDQDYPATAQPITNGTALLFTSEPYLNIEPFLTLSTVEINETNGNGYLEPGESVELNFTITNTGQTDAVNVEANLTTPDENITLITTQDTYDLIPGNDGSATNQIAFTATISPSAADGHEIPLILTLSTADDTWILNISLIVSSPEIGYSGVMLSDYETGNGNGIGNTDESFYLVFNLNNSTSAPMFNVQTEISCTNSGVIFSDNNQIIPVIPAQNSLQVVHTLTIPPSVSNGSAMIFTFSAQGSGTLTTTESFNFVVGNPSNLTSCGVISGSVSVNEGEPDLSEILVTASPSIHQQFSEDDGSFKLYAPIGAYSVRASLQHYHCSAVQIIAITGTNHLVTNVNLELDMLPVPTNLSGNYSEQELNLTWSAPTIGDLTIISYNIHCSYNNEDSILIGTSETEDYSADITDEGIYTYYIEAVYTEGISYPSNVFVYDTAQNNTGDEITPLVTELFGNYPNPFNPTTNIAYSLAVTGNVKIDLYNIRGQHVRTLMDEIQSSGKHVIQWDGRDDNQIECASGLYMYRFQTKGVNTIKKALLLK
jgi:hypothetical protein